LAKKDARQPQRPQSATNKKFLTDEARSMKLKEMESLANIKSE